MGGEDAWANVDKTQVTRQRVVHFTAQCRAFLLSIPVEICTIMCRQVSSLRYPSFASQVGSPSS